MPIEESARRAYDRYAPRYDECNAQNDYEMWLGEVLLPELNKHGLRKGWALDVGCGTGRAFDPLLARGWQIVGCDVSSAMLAEASRKFGPKISLVHADARALPVFCPSPDLPAAEPFQLVLLLNDVLNYITEEGDLERVFAGIERNLSRDGGLMVFDINTISLFRTVFASDVAIEMSARGGLEWYGLTDEVLPGGVYEGRLSGVGVNPHVHRQRHWTVEQVIEALGATGLCCLATLGQQEKNGRIVLSEPPDEDRDYKIIFIARHLTQGR